MGAVLPGPYVGTRINNRSVRLNSRVASGKAADKKQEYADRAMELLHASVKAGYKDAAKLAKDRDLDVLRERDDFKKLMQALAKPKEKGSAGKTQ